MLAEAALATAGNGETSRAGLAPEIAGVRIDFADIVCDARVDISTTVRVLELENVVLEVAVLLANLEGDAVVGVWGVLLCVLPTVSS